jgi:hypothetical protein
MIGGSNLSQAAKIKMSFSGSVFVYGVATIAGYTETSGHLLCSLFPVEEPNHDA